MSYRIEVRLAAAKALAQLERADALRLRGVIALLAANPRPPGARRLVGRPAYRVRSGNYRIIYTVEDTVLLGVVVALGHRRDIYRTP